MIVIAALVPAPAGAKPGVRRSKLPPAGRPDKRMPRVKVIVTSADLRQALTPAGRISWSTLEPHTPTIRVNEAVRYQRIRGVGGAMTDTSAWLMSTQLPPGTRAFVMRRLFSPARGIDLRFIRIPIGATDFTVNRTPYTYDDLPPGQTDPSLTHFSILHDAFYIIPALRQALSLDPQAFVLATPWSPPAWMKTNDSLANPGNDLGFLRQIAYTPWAQYFVKFIQDYGQAGVHIDAVTPQNEPGIQTLYPGMTMNQYTESRFIRDALRPALRAARLQTQIYGYDSNWATVSVPFARYVATGPAADDLAGISTHCYSGAPTMISTLHSAAPQLDEIVAECAEGSLPFTSSETEIASFRNWASTVALWNFALDPRGGPVQLPNLGCAACRGLVTIDPRTHTFRFTVDYYQLGQCSKYVQPGAVRIGSNNFVTYGYSPTTGAIASAGLDDVAFMNPDRSRVLLAYNSSPAPIAFAVQDDGHYFTYRLGAGATATFEWKASQPQPELRTRGSSEAPHAAQ